MEEQILEKPATADVTSKPKLAFLGVGWIGRNRMKAIADSELAEITCIADTAESCIEEAQKDVPQAQKISTLEELLMTDADGIVIATPSALHAQQSIAALEAGKAVFCQKPLGRTAEETRQVVAEARKADKLLGVDLSYRYTKAVQAVKEVLDSGELGHIYAVELVFHNAYGPDKPWFYDAKLSGGGCVIDLGVHLVDLALWGLNFPEVEKVSSRLFAKGQELRDSSTQVEDFATASIDLEGNTNVQLSCSWNLQAGREAIIGATFYGTNGGVAFKNINGSFYDFVAERYYGTKTENLISAPDNWGGRAGVAWAEKLAKGSGFDEEAEELIKVAEVLDRIYGR